MCEGTCPSRQRYRSSDWDRLWGAYGLSGTNITRARAKVNTSKGHCLGLLEYKIKWTPSPKSYSAAVVSE